VRVDSIIHSVKIAEAAGATVVLEFLDAAPAGRMAVLEDPGGAVISLWEPLTRQGAMRVNEAGARAMSTLLSTDPQASAAFYREVFGWTTETFSAGDNEVPVPIARLRRRGTPAAGVT
jgi:predicted enzyme related to lactoylglutathione lyase